jgi:diguanylate cyclase (GGDEF)-like protein
MRILLVEDDQAIAAVVTDFLTKQHYVVDVANDGQAGWDLVEAFTYDLILLDVMLPKIDGITLCRRLRSGGYRMPILLLTACHTSIDKVRGLDVGADDYVVKPFDLKELGARIRALLRRGNSALAPVLEWENLRLDPSTCEVTYGSQLLHLSSKEYSLVELFLRNNRRIFSRSVILDQLWSCEDAPREDTVKAHIKKLRQKLKSAGAPADLIETVYGMGYRLKPILVQEEARNLPQIVAAGLPEKLGAWLQQRLSPVSVQLTSTSEQILNELERGNWSLLILDHRVISPAVAKVLEGAYSQLRQGKKSVVYCLEKNLDTNLPKKLIGQILFHPLDWEELAGVVAETLELPLSPPETRVEEEESETEGEDENITPSLAHPINTPTLQAAIAGIWEEFKDKIISRVAVLDQATKALLAGRLSDELRQEAQREAHKLAGSLGTFGFCEGSCLAREIEQILAQSRDVAGNVSTAVLLSELVAALHREINKPPANTEEASVYSSSFLIPNYSLAEQPRLLIVEDDIELAQRLVLEAVAWGMQADRVNNFSVAREIIQNAHPDLVVLDLSFPDATDEGLALLEELSNQSPPVPVIVLTFRNTFIARVEVARLGGCAFLHKPVTAAQVMEVVSLVLQQGRTDQFKVLAVDDDPQILATLEVLLQPWGVKIRTLDDPRRLWDVLEATGPDLLILDVDMPHVSGIELCKVIRNDPKWNSLPVLFLSVHKDAETVQRMFGVGADDYVSKPIGGSELVTRIFNRLERLRLLRSIAETDLLTGVANRRKSTQDVERFLSLAHHKGEPFCFAILDLDNFKRINDQYGHASGDKVLNRLGKLLLQSFRSEDVVARWGGEEFVIGMYGMTKQAAVKRLSQVLETLRKEEFIELDGRKFRVTFSAGIVQYPEDGANLQSLYQTADQVLYQAKAAGRDRVLSK